MSENRELYQFYVNGRCGFIYETIDDVKRALAISDMAVGEYDIKSAIAEAEFLKHRGISLDATEDKAPIFLLEKIKEEQYLEEFWHVIIGDKVGWIYAPNWLINPLKDEKVI